MNSNQPPDLARPAKRHRPWWITVGLIALMGLIGWRNGEISLQDLLSALGEPGAQSLDPPSAELEESAVVVSTPSSTEPTTSDADLARATSRQVIVIRNITVRDLSGRVAYRGDVDLTETLQRIERGERHSHRNDGGVFRNLEGRLPRQPSGYYREYVHPTPGLDGPGPQRIIVGQGGDTYYTSDHYRTFQKILP